MKLAEDERILVLGGSRGLGAAIVTEFSQKNFNVTSFSRKSKIKADFANPEKWNDILIQVKEYHPTRIIFCAGGGPYGPYGEYQWKDHSWALKVTFEFPAFLLHYLIQNPLSELQQISIIGSSIAESKPDPGAAAYCAAKHALRGLVTSLQKENLPFDLRLLSPGYMKTDLLPIDSAPRNEGRARDPFDIARLMIHSISDPALRLQNQSFD